MKRSLTGAKTRAVCVGLAVLSAVGWSCSKQDEPVMNDNQQTQGVIAQARSYYESTAPSLTKTVADQTIAIKPLPGDMTPLWDRASATVLSDGTTAWVDVPIEAGVTYTAVRDGHHHHEAGEECGHDHTTVQAVQKLTIHTLADGTKQSLIATIVREPDCTVDANGFSSGDGLAGFSGFVSWHDLTGKLVRVAKYENGAKTRSVEAAEDNNAAVLEVVDGAILYQVSTNNIQTKSYQDDKCYICDKVSCKHKNIALQHCEKCSQEFLNCTCKRCPTCGLKGSLCNCNKPSVHPKNCDICGKLLCPHLAGSSVNGPITIDFTCVNDNILNDILKSRMTLDQFKSLQYGNYQVDQEYQNKDDEYMHGLYVPEDNSSQNIALAKMRAHFVRMALFFINAGSYVDLGWALHPILDTYVEMRTRVDMLNYYTYANLNNVVHGMNSAPYVNNPTPCTEAVQYIYGALKELPVTATASEIGAIFDQWVGTTGGGDPLL